MAGEGRTVETTSDLRLNQKVLLELTADEIHRR
jgi:hypothetical protein